MGRYLLINYKINQRSFKKNIKKRKNETELKLTKVFSLQNKIIY